MPRAQDGFTLVEILVALVVMGLIAGIILPGFVLARQREREAAERISAVRFAAGQLRLLEAMPETVTPSRGQFGKWAWTLKVATERGDGRARRLALRQMTIQVRTLGRDHPPVLLSSTKIAPPAPEAVP